MSFGGNNTPTAPPNPLGVSRHRGSTNQQAIPIPYVAGIARLGVGWISDKFNVKTVAVSSHSGKGQSSVSGYNYYASIAFRVCEGPVDAIFAIYLNGDRVWGVDGPYTTPPLTRGAPGTATADFVIINIPTHGTFRFYWGTDTQTFDPVLATNTTLTLDDNTVDTSDSTVRIKHSAYRGTCYGVADQMFLGFNQTNFQNIEIVVGKWPSPNWMTAPNKIGNDANPVAISDDWWSNARYGLGLPSANIGAAVMNATGQQLFDEGIGVSPLLDTEKAARDLLLNLAEYVGGYCYCDENGSFAIGLKRVAGSAATLDATKWMARPSFDPTDFSQAISELRITFTNIEDDLTGDYVPYATPGLRWINEQNRTTATLERPWFTSKPVATMMAIAEGNARGLPTITGRVPLLRIGGLYETLSPGTTFSFDYPERNLGHKTFRVVSRSISDPSKPTFEIRFEEDKSYVYAELQLAGEIGGGGEGGGDDDDTAVPSAFGKPVELPAGLCLDGEIAMAILVARSDASMIGYDVYLEKNYAGGDSYALISRQSRFAKHGELQSELPTNTLMIDRIGFLLQLEGPDTTLDEQTDFDGLNNAMLVFIGDEVLSIAGWTLEGPGLYRLFCVRQQFGTERLAHDIGDEAFIISRSDLVALKHKHFEIRNTAAFKVAMRSANSSTDLSLVEPVELEISGKVFALPTPENLRVNGRLRPTFNAGASVAIDWSLTNAGVEVPKVKMVLDFLALDDTSLGSMKTPAGKVRLSNSQLVPLLSGVEQSFRLRARFETERPEGFVYSPATEVLVTKL